MAKRSHTKAEFDEQVKQPLPIGSWLAVAVIFGGAFWLRLWFNFLLPHINNYGSCDASEYLRNAGALLNLHLSSAFWTDAWQCLSGQASAASQAAIKEALAPLQDFSISGPIFPIFLAVSYLVGLQPFSMEGWMPPVFAQCLISALMCVFVALTGKHAFNAKTGYLAGALCAVYPAFILNSGRLYSETFAAFLLSVICFATVRGLTRDLDAAETWKLAVVNGFFAACLQFTRSVMIVLTAVLLPITLLQQGLRKGVVALLVFALGFIFVAAPWLAFQKLAFGSMNIVLDRVGHYNFFIGNYVDSAGWLSFPYQNGSGIDQTPMPTLAKEAVQRSPSRWIRLMQDKPLRLLKFPWNDFRNPVGDLDFHAQVLIHQLLLLLAFIGMVLGFTMREGPAGPDTGYEQNHNQSRNPNGAKLFLIFTLLLHGAYLFFITVPRYNLTAMPLVILFAAAGITGVLGLLRLRNGFLPACCVSLSAVVFFAMTNVSAVPWLATIAGGKNAAVGLVFDALLKVWSLGLFGYALWFAVARQTDEKVSGHKQAPGKLLSRVALALCSVAGLLFVVFPANANGRWNEWHAQLQSGETVTQNFALPADFDKQITGTQLYLLVDADSAESLQSAKIAVNGAALDQPKIAGIALTDDFSRFQNIPQGGFMRESEWVFDCLTQSAGLKNTDLRQWFIVPVPNNLLSGKRTATVQLTGTASNITPVLYGSYDTGSKLLSVPSLPICSWEKAFYGVENDHGFSDPRFEQKINPATVVPTTKDLCREHGAQTGRFNMLLLAGPPVAVNTTIYTVEREQTTPPQMVPLFTARSGQTMVVRDSSPNHNFKLQTIPQYSTNDWWVVRLTGQARRNVGTARLVFDVKGVCLDPKKPYVSPWASTTSLNTQWQPFDVAVPLVPAALGAPMHQITCDVHVQDPSALTSGELRADGLTELKGVSMQILRLPSNPLGRGHRII